MSVYTINGAGTDVAYDASGNRLQQAYDINGNGLLSNVLVVMSYNVQDFSGINSQQAMQNAIVGLYGADIIGIQEFYRQDSVPTIASNMLSSYPNLYRTNHKNFNAIATKRGFSNITVADFENQDPSDMTNYSETRCYIKGYFTWGDKTVCFINTHLCLTPSYQYLQMAEIYALAQQEEYCIITGDFNFEGLDEESIHYENMYKQFVDAGYKLVNGNDEVGFVKTYSNLTSATTLSDFRSAPDNIIVSGNINIDSIVFDTTKLSYLNGSVIDHIPIVATLSLSEEE